jgi:hypothetical protein
MEEFLKEENERAEKGDDSKPHSFTKSVRDTVDRIKSFIKSATEEKAS